jgi:hypothetical protein
VHNRVDLVSDQLSIPFATLRPLQDAMAAVPVRLETSTP